MKNQKLKEFKIINLHSNETNKIKYSNYIDININHNSDEFEEIYIGEMIELFNITPEEMNQIAQAKSRLITLHTVELQAHNLDLFTVRARVSHGAYIRSLMNDIARRAGTHATTHELERAAIGPFALDQVVLLSDITTIDHIVVNCISVESMLLKIAEYKM